MSRSSMWGTHRGRRVRIIGQATGVLLVAVWTISSVTEASGRAVETEAEKAPARVWVDKDGRELSSRAQELAGVQMVAAPQVVARQANPFAPDLAGMQSVTESGSEDASSKSSAEVLMPSKDGGVVPSTSPGVSPTSSVRMPGLKPSTSGSASSSATSAAEPGERGGGSGDGGASFDGLPENPTLPSAGGVNPAAVTRSKPTTAVGETRAVAAASDESRGAAIRAAQEFATTYTTYSAASTSAERFSASLPNTTESVKAEILKQSQEVWARFTSDQRVSKGSAAGEPSVLSATESSAVVLVPMNVEDTGDSFSETYQITFTCTMVRNGSKWLLESVTV